MSLPWAFSSAVTYSRKRKHWNAYIRLPGATARRKRLSANTFPEIIVMYLAAAFDRESLLAAAETAAPRETMIKRAKSIKQRNRKEPPQCQKLRNTPA